MGDVVALAFVAFVVHLVGYPFSFQTSLQSLTHSRKMKTLEIEMKL